MKPPASPLRWARAWVLGSSAVGLAVGGHLLGGGHVEPVFAALLLCAVSLGSYGWLKRERGLVAITSAVGALQLLTHLAFSAGHAHAVDGVMVGGHAAAAVLLAGFLRWGESRVYSASRRRYLEWLTAVRCAFSGVSAAPARRRPVVVAAPVLCENWIRSAWRGRGPPVAA